jgi:hypothetical protein
MIGDALEATPGALPFEPGDVLVVTQKVVSKAEGAVVDLRTVTPGPQAIAWAEQWDRNPRQIQVVLDEAARIVRMERGVLIVETRHGFVCERRRRRVLGESRLGDAIHSCRGRMRARLDRAPCRPVRHGRRGGDLGRLPSTALGHRRRRAGVSTLPPSRTCAVSQAADA